MLGPKPCRTGRSVQACPLLFHRAAGSGQSIKHEPKTTTPAQRKVATTFGRMKDTQRAPTPKKGPAHTFENNDYVQGVSQETI